MKRFIQGEYRGQSTLFAERILSDTELRGHFQSVFGTSPDGKLDEKSHLLDTMLELEVIRPKSACMIGNKRDDIIAAHQTDYLPLASIGATAPARS